MKNNYLKIKKFNKNNYLKTLRLLENKKVNTVCLSGNCPNRYECFSKSTATFMILGDICTRNCKYCNIENKKPEIVNKNEAENISQVVDKLNLDYVVITSVTRDDLEDGGADQFQLTVEKIREKRKSCKIELLIPDFGGNNLALEKTVNLKPYVLNHNIETVDELFPKLRPEGNYLRSLSLLKKAKELNNQIKTKSGIMLGLGETKKQVLDTLKDLKKSKVEILTIGQYLAPSPKHAKVEKYYTNKEFLVYKNLAYKMGFKHVQAGFYVRSSYKAKTYE